MKTIETKGRIDDCGVLIAQLPPGFPPGEHSVIVSIREDVSPQSDLPNTFPIAFKTIALDSWPRQSTYRREDIYGDQGR